MEPWAVFLIVFGVVMFTALSLFVPPFFTARKKYYELLVRTSKDKWIRHCSWPEDEEQSEMYRRGEKWAEQYAGNKVDVDCYSEKLHLFGEYFDFGADRAVIIIPGRMEACGYSYYFSEPYRAAGYNVLVIDNRAHGLSDGKYNSLGKHEHKDVLEWAKLLHDTFGVKSVLLHGVCIGSSTAAYALADKNCPDYVVGMVADHEEVVTVTGSGIPNTTIAAGTTSATYTATAAGTYSVSLSLAAGASSNYSIAAATTFAEWTIAQKEVTVTWTKDTLADGAYVYGWTSYSVVYSAVERSVTPSVSGIIAGDTVTFTTQQTAATNVGNYSSAVTALTGTDAGNYALPAVTAQAWSITAATITGVTISPVNGVYNAAPQGPEVNRYTTQHGISLNAVYSGGVNKTREQ